MQINPVNQTTDFNLPSRNGAEKSEHPAADNRQKEPLKETRDQVEIKEAVSVKVASVKQNTSLKFSRDRDTNELVVELVNNQTGESLRQTPSDVSLKLSAIYAGLQGKLVNKKY